MVRKYKRKTGRAYWVEADMKNALRAVKNKELSLRAAATKFKINKDAIQRRLSGKTKFPNEILHKNHLGSKWRVLSDDQELELIDYILKMEVSLYGITIEDLRRLVFQYCRQNEVTNPFNKELGIAGKDWATSFLQRHPEISIRKPESLSLSRAMGMDRNEIKKFYDNLDLIYKSNGLSSSDVYNMDETGTQNVHRPSKILAQKGRKSVSAITSGERGKTVTIICCANATGQMVPPILIFPRKNIKISLTDDAPAGTLQCVSDNGWITETIFLEFLKHFVKNVRCSNERKVLLILDGHTTHTKNLDSISYACKNGIILLSLPPHTTQRLQPLDVSFFRPFKTAYDKACQLWMRNHPGRKVMIDNIAGLCRLAIEKAATPGNIAHGFSATGIWPFNPEIIKDSEYRVSIEISKNNECTETTEADDQPINNFDVIDHSALPNIAELTGITSHNTPTQKMITIDLENVEFIFDDQVTMVNPNDVILFEGIIEQNPSPPTINLTFADISPVPEIKCKKRSKQCGTSHILTSSSYKNCLAEKQLKKLTKPNKQLKKLTKPNNKLNQKEVKKKNKRNSNPKQKENLASSQEDARCLTCDDLWSQSKPGDEWIQCIDCLGWLHSRCTNQQSSSRGFRCDNCR